jgi:hypothetical protein
VTTAMDFKSVEAIREAGFVGFSAVRNLHTHRCDGVPREPGVYLVLRDVMRPRCFSPVSCGGHFKGKDPTVPVSKLEAHWIEPAIVLYIGKAGGGRSRSTLQERLWCYMRFGAGEPVGHWGGRLIWQLAHCQDLIVCWRPSIDHDAEELESKLIQDFSGIYGRRPFANLRN